MRQHSFPDARSLHGLTAPPGRDVAFWHFSDLMVRTGDVGFIEVKRTSQPRPLKSENGPGAAFEQNCQWSRPR